MPKPILISGIQPTGKLHLGNYLGALKNFVDLQNSGKFDCYFFIADYHSLTEDFNSKEKSKQVIDLAATYLSAGLDPKKSTIFLQSNVPETTELAWILSTITPFGELRRMTQFKDKSENQQENINVGLFTYPILMAADILLYGAKFVPVGEDQLQHLELTRTLARKFNKQFSKTFVEPQPLLTQVPRLMSLDDPLKKMSKSRAEGCLFIDDHPAHIQKKFAKAVTDSGKDVRYEPQSKPGISNMLLIMSELSGKPIKELESTFSGSNYSEFKHALSDVVSDYFTAYREKKKTLSKKPAELKKVLSAGKEKAANVAAEKIKEVKSKVGLKY